MPKAKKKTHNCRTHEECRKWVCILCLKKSDGNGIPKSMEDFIIQQGICSDFQFQKPYLPSGSCRCCRTYVSRFWKKGTPVKAQSSDDYLSISNEIRNLPIETRNPASKLECRCQICLIARSRKSAKTVHVSSLNEDEELPKKCPNCLSLIGRGHNHSPNSCKSSSTLLDNLEKQLPPQVQERFASRIIDKVEKNSVGQSVLHTAGGRPKLVSTGPPPEEPVQISHNTFFKIEREVGLSRNQTNSVKTILTNDTKKRKLVEPYLKEKLIEQGRICDEYFHVNEKMALVGKDDLPVTRPVVLCRDVPNFIDFVNETKKPTDKDFIRKLGMDSGKGSLKITLNLMGASENLKKSVPEDSHEDSDESDSESVQEGPSTSSSVKGLASTVHALVSSGSDSDSETPASLSKKARKSKYLDSGVKQLFLLALAPDTKESYANMKLILDALKVFESNNDFSIASDMKLYSILLGIQPHSSTYPCIWCEGKKCEYDPNAALRTLGRCREYAKKFKLAVAEAELNGKKAPLPKEFMCCENDPLLPGPDYTLVLDILPPPELHLMTGVSFHIFKGIAKEMGEDSAYQWLEKYVGKVDPSMGFKGKQARSFLKKADEMARCRTPKFPRRLMKFIHALQKFNKVVSSCFGKKLKRNRYIENIRAFKIAFMALGISVTPKVHCVFRHVQEFCEPRKCGLGVYSEQVVEASHYDFAKVERWYPTNLKTDPRCAEKLLNAVTRYNGSHLPINQ